MRPEFIDNGILRMLTENVENPHPDKIGVTYHPWM